MGRQRNRDKMQCSNKGISGLKLAIVGQIEGGRSYLRGSDEQKEDLLDWSEGGDKRVVGKDAPDKKACEGEF
jgi:hypothetical protein